MNDNKTDEWLRVTLTTGSHAGTLLRDLEAINVCLDAVYGKILTSEQLRPVYPHTVAAVKVCLDFKSEDLKIQSEVSEFIARGL